MSANTPTDELMAIVETIAQINKSISALTDTVRILLDRIERLEARP